MGHIKDIANQPKIQPFPSATFEIVGEVPAAQCSEYRFEGDDAETWSLPHFRLWHASKFTGWDLTGKVCHITANPGGNTGDFNIISNTLNALKLVQDPGNGNPTTYFIPNGGTMIIPRTIVSFASYIQAAGYAYTIKGGKLYTDMPSGQLKDACSILFDPLT